MEAISDAFARLGSIAAQSNADSRAEHAGHGSHHAGSGGQLSLVRDNPYSPCEGISDPYAESCWLFQGFVILRYNEFRAAEALRACDAAPDGRMARCYESIGHQLTGLFQRDDQWILQQCAKGRPELASHCAAGATLALNGMDWSGGRAARFCGAAPGDWKAMCYRVAARSLISLASPAERSRLCQKVEREYAPICRRAAAVGPG
jgi:hypothetical protein